MKDCVFYRTLCEDGVGDTLSVEVVEDNLNILCVIPDIILYRVVRIFIKVN